MEYKYNSKLRPRQFQVADLVMRKAHPYQLENKLSHKWTDPFRVIEVLGNAAYRLKMLEGGTIPRTWNATNLKFILVKNILHCTHSKGALFFPHKGFFNEVTRIKFQLFS